MIQRHTSTHAPGSVIQHRYQVVRRLGRGGMASAYLVRDLIFDRELALKQLELAGASARQLFQSEFSRLAGLYHPRLTRVHDFGAAWSEQGSQSFYTADFVEGASLDRFAIARSWSNVVRPLCDAVHALGFLHGLGLRHGDFKPQNVMVDREGRGTLIDLGCAAPLCTAAPDLSGTPAYFAPELLDGGEVDGRTDLYSVGVAIEELSRRVQGALPAPARRLMQRLTERNLRDRPSEASEILEVLGDDEPLQHAPLGAAPRMVGREAELARFETALEALLAGRPGPRAWVWVGPAGVGKSRLLAEAKWLAQLRADVVEGLTTAPSTVHSMLRRALSQDGLQDGVAGVIAAYEQLSGRDRPVLVCLDDFDRLERPERQAFDALIRCLALDDRVFVLAAGRTEPRLTSPALEVHSVEPLGAAALQQWAGGLVSPARLDELVSATGGVPANVMSVLRQLVAGDRTEAQLGAVLSRARVDQAAPSAAGRQSLADDVAQLDEQQQQALVTIAALGGVVAESDWPGELSRPALAQLSVSGWLHRQGATWRLGSMANAGAIAAGLPADQVAAVHARIAAAIRSRREDARVADPRDGARLVHHLVKAGKLGAAERHFIAAELEQRAEPEAWSFATELLGEQSRSTAVLLRLAALHEWAGRAELGLSVLARLVRREPKRRQDSEVCYVAARCADALGRSNRALRYLERALAAPRVEAKPALRSSIVELLVRVRIRRGQYAQALELAERELRVCDDAVVRAGLSQSVGIAAGYLGDAVRAREQLRLAAASFGEVGSAAERVRSLSYLAIVEFRQGNLEPAIEHYRQAARLAEQHGLTPMLATTLLNLGTACQRQGNWGAALDQYERALRLATALGRTSTEATLRVNLANLYVDIGSFDRGVAALARVRSLVAAAGLTHVEGMVLIIEGEVSLARGDLAEAREHFAAAQAFYRERESWREALEAELHLAEVDLASGALEDAASRLAAMAPRLEALSAADVSAQRASLEGQCVLARGEPERALAVYDSALELAARAGQPLLEAHVQTLRSAAQRRLGRTEECEESLARARKLWERVADTLPLPLRDVFWQHHRRSELATATMPLFPPALAPTQHPSAAHAALTRFLEVNQRINSSLSVDRVLAYAMDAAIELTGAERGFVLLAPTSDPLAAPYEVAVARNLDRERVGRDNYEFSTSIAERVLRTGEPISTVDAQSDERFAEHRSVHAMRLQSVACVPISAPQGALGALYLDNRYQRGRFTTADLQLLMAFAHQVAIALNNARMHAALQQRTEELAAEKRAVEKLSRGQAREIQRLAREVAARQEALEFRYDYEQIIGRSAPMRKVLSTLDRVIDSPLTIHIQGESGTGKELVARAVHFNSPRRDRPFVSINCAALPEALLESELFGHVRGAFTGATQDKPGLMVAARGGTLFLDEVGDMPLSMQVKLLRVLQEREVRPVGGRSVMPVDVRVVSATNRDLGVEVQKGTFREDLFYRLSVVVLEMPPLRERSEDIPALTTAIVARLARDNDRSAVEVTPAALRMLMQYRWPGNVRQLENVLAKAFYLCDRKRIDVTDVDLPSRLGKPRRALDRRQYEREESARIIDALHQTRWNVSAVARSLGMPRNTLYRKLKKYGIARAADPASNG